MPANDITAQRRVHVTVNGAVREAVLRVFADGRVSITGGTLELEIAGDDARYIAHAIGDTYSDF